MIIPGSTVPDLTVPMINGDSFKLSDQSPEHFTLFVFFRGKHCPICRNQLKDLAAKQGDFAELGVEVVAISMDSEERAQVVHDEWETGNVPVAYGLSEEDARAWGLYITQKRPDSEEPDIFSEPGMFLVRPDMSLYFASVQNAPFTRPPFDELLKGVEFITSKGYPTRGTLT